jgi:hypothetical protein
MRGLRLERIKVFVKLILFVTELSISFQTSPLNQLTISLTSGTRPTD